MNPDGLVYNVYVVTDSFEVFEKQFPHLVGIDSRGNLVRKIEFMEREKEEMRNLTRASEIADGVFLGNTGDVPLLTNPPAPLVAPQSHPGNPATLPVYPGLDPFDGSNNSGAYDICIECHDMASFPSYAQLRGVEDRLKALEEAWRQRVRDAAAFNLDREQQEAAMRKKREEVRRREELRRRREAELDMDMDLDEEEAEDENEGLTSSSSPSPPHSSSSVTSEQQQRKDVKVLDGGMGLGLDYRPLSPPVEPGAMSPRTAEMMNSLAVSSPRMVGQDTIPGSESLPSLFPKTEATPIPVPATQPRQHHHHHHTRSKSLGTSLSSYGSSPASPSPRMTSTKARGTIPPRPPPNASQVIHLAFPSSPPATPGTLTSLIPFLHFLHGLTKPRPPTPEYVVPEGVAAAGGRSAGSRARSPSLSNGGAVSGRAGGMGHARSGSLSSGISPRTRSHTMVGFSSVMSGASPSSASSLGRRGSQGSASAVAAAASLGANVPLSRPLRILLHAGDGYTETSVLALSYIMLTGNKTLPEAYLELQVNRSRSFFVYAADVGVLRRVEQRLKLEREREREKIAASIAATAASVGASNGSGSSTPRASAAATGKDASGTRGGTSPPSSSAKWRWTGLPSSWRSGSLSSAGVSLLNGAGMFSS
ncbi:tyrosine/serine/threonine protein phosphatase pps1, partial [Tulasnella sp. 427]